MILGIDYGTKKIGLALGDEETRLAIPWRVIENTSRKKTIEALTIVISEHAISRIVVGVPFSSVGDETPQTKTTKKFVSFLKNSFSLPIEEEDEFFSTKEARAKLHEAGLKKQIVDAHSAAIILQTWIDRQK